MKLRELVCVFCILLVGCAGTSKNSALTGQSDSKNSVLTGQRDSVIVIMDLPDSFPNPDPKLGLVSRAEVGGIIYTEYTKGVYLKSDYAVPFAMGGKIKIKPDSFLQYYDFGGKIQYCSADLTYFDEFIGAYDKVCFCDTDNSGDFDKASVPQIMWGEWKDIKRTAYKKSRKKTELVYEGISGNVLKLEYREYEADSQQPDFNEEVTHTLNPEKTAIDFRGAKLEIVGVSDGNLLTYKVLNGFDYDVHKRYAGQYKNGMRHGQGTFTFSNGMKYVGEFRNDKPNGRGTMTTPDGTEITGFFRDGVAHGKAKMNLPDGKKYEGDFKNGMPNGRGVLTSPNGTKYEGEMLTGVPHGRGIITLPDGRRIPARFKYGKPVK